MYKRPVAIFFFPAPPKEDNIKKSFRTIPESEFKRLPSALIRQIRKAMVKQENLYDLCNGRNPSESRLTRKITNIWSYGIKELSASIRNILGVSLNEQKSLASVESALEKWRISFEEHGIFVFKDAFRNNNFSGFCLYDEEFPLIIINNSMPKTRQIFTLFHELGHLLFETSGIDKLDDEHINILPEQDKDIEILCNKLAAEIIVPAGDFDRYARDIPFKEN